MILQFVNVLVLASLAGTSQPTTAPGMVMPAAGPMKFPKNLDVSAIRALPVQADGRWVPLDTLARDLVYKVTGRFYFQGQDPVVVLLSWSSDPMSWMQQPLISLKNAELRGELRLSATQTVFSFTELLKDEYLVKMMTQPPPMEPGAKPNALQLKVDDIKDKLDTLRDVFGRKAICVVPDPKDPNGAWKAIAAAMPHGQPAAGDPSREAWDAMSKAFLADDGKAFAESSDKLIKTLAALPAAHRPEPEMIQTELQYNRLRPVRTAWIILAVGAAFAGLAMGVQRRWFDLIAALPLVAGLAVHSYGLWLRWQIAGRIPASNMYESLLFLGWGMALFAIFARFVFKQRLVLLTASGMAALALMLADVLPLDPFVRPIVPVLMDTYWMSIHVPVIMVSYSVLALGVLVAHVQLVAMAAAPGNRQLAATIDSLHYWYIHVGSILLTAGIFTGSMWAASSWGRYWGWDPKEVWSLVALLGYLTILHVRISGERTPAWAYIVGGALAIAVFALVLRSVGTVSEEQVGALLASLIAIAFMAMVRGPFATAVKSILCFWMVLMTYLGVNYILGVGLHSYGFGTGAVARNMFYAGMIDLGLVAVLALVYRVRREPPLPAKLPVAAAVRG